MKAATIAIAVSAVLGFFILKSATVQPPATPAEPPAVQDYASIFRQLEATKAQVASDRAFIETYRSWAPTQAA